MSTPNVKILTNCVTLFALMQTLLSTITVKYDQDTFDPIPIKSDFKLNLNDIFDMTKLDIASFDYKIQLLDKNGSIVKEQVGDNIWYWDMRLDNSWPQTHKYEYFELKPISGEGKDAIYKAFQTRKCEFGNIHLSKSNPTKISYLTLKECKIAVFERLSLISRVSRGEESDSFIYHFDLIGYMPQKGKFNFMYFPEANRFNIDIPKFSMMPQI